MYRLIIADDERIVLTGIKNTIDWASMDVEVVATAQDGEELYQKAVEYAPDIATNNYNPYPEPDADGVYPYVYGMGVIKGMRVREDGVVYCCILETESPYKLIYPPSAVPALFTAE